MWSNISFTVFHLAISSPSCAPCCPSGAPCCPSIELLSGFPPMGVRTPPLSTTGGGISPPCWQEKLKYFLYFTVISGKIGHFKHQNLKTLIFFSPGGVPRPPTPFGPPLSNIPGGNPDCYVIFNPPRPLSQWKTPRSLMSCIHTYDAIGQFHGVGRTFRTLILCLVP